MRELTETEQAEYDKMSVLEKKLYEPPEFPLVGLGTWAMTVSGNYAFWGVNRSIAADLLESKDE